jgi:hypothetical protein
MFVPNRKGGTNWILFPSHAECIQRFGVDIFPMYLTCKVSHGAPTASFAVPSTVKTGAQITCPTRRLFAWHRSPNLSKFESRQLSFWHAYSARLEDTGKGWTKGAQLAWSG